MNKDLLKKLIIICSIILVTLFVIIYKDNSVNLINKDWISIDSFIKNNSSQGAYEKNTIYKKWDLLDYISFINFWNGKNIKLDISLIKNNINIDEIYINDEKTDEQKINNLNLNWMTKVKVVWKAKNNNLDWSLIENNLIKVTVIQDIKKEQTKIEEKVIIKWQVPSNINIKNSNFSSNINNLLQIEWANLELIDYVNIWWFSIKPQFDSWILLVSIDKNSFSSWDYFIFFQLKSWEIMPTDNKITFTHNQQKINIANLTPSIIKNNEDRFIVIQWNWFKKIISVQLNNNVILKNTSFNIINDNVAAVKIPRWLALWTYYFNIMDTDSIYELKNNSFTITN